MHPILFQIGDFVIGTYGVMIVLGLIAGLFVISRVAPRRGLPMDFFYDLLFVVLVAGFVGARATFIGLEWPEFMRDPLGLLFSRQGFVFLGGFVTATAAAAWFCRRRRMPVWEVADVVAPGLVLGHAFGRIGCFLAGCCFGIVCEPGAHPVLSDVAVSFPVVRDSSGAINQMFNFAYGTQVAAGDLAPAAAHTLPMVPVQLFESFGNAMICLMLLWMWRRRRFSGQIAASYLMLYSVLRFGLEFIRGDAERGVFFHGMLSTSQIICIFTVAGGIALWWWRRGKSVQEYVPEPATAQPGAGRSGGKSPAPRRGTKPTAGRS